MDEPLFHSPALRHRLSSKKESHEQSGSGSGSGSRQNENRGAGLCYERTYSRRGEEGKEQGKNQMWGRGQNQERKDPKTNDPKRKEEGRRKRTKTAHVGTTCRTRQSRCGTSDGRRGPPVTTQQSSRAATKRCSVPGARLSAFACSAPNVGKQTGEYIGTVDPSAPANGKLQNRGGEYTNTERIQAICSDQPQPPLSSAALRAWLTRPHRDCALLCTGVSAKPILPFACSILPEGKWSFGILSTPCPPPRFLSFPISLPLTQPSGGMLLLPGRPTRRPKSSTFSSPVLASFLWKKYAYSVISAPARPSSHDVLEACPFLPPLLSPFLPLAGTPTVVSRAPQAVQHECRSTAKEHI